MNATAFGVFMILGWLIGRDVGRLVLLIHDTRRLRRENERLERHIMELEVRRQSG